MMRLGRTILITSLALFLAGSIVSGVAFADNKSGASKQDKAQACNNTADKRGLKGNDREDFLRSCLNKAAGNEPANQMSEKDKSTVCKNLADKKNLTGQDRRSYIKDCMNMSNPR